MTIDSESRNEYARRIGEAVLKAAQQDTMSNVPIRPGIRKQSARTLLGWPLFSLALGGDPSRGHRLGHARGIIAIGDTAIGVVAIGRMLSLGLLSIGNGAVGLVSIGSLTLGILASVGGLAAGGLALGGLALGVVAVGGAAIGYVAVGGLAIGYYALGGAAIGQHVISGVAQDPQAVAFFRDHFPALEGILPKRPGR